MAKKTSTKDLMNVLVYVLFAVIIIPIMASQVALLGEDGNLSTAEAAIVALITTFIILGVVYAIVKTVL